MACDPDQLLEDARYLFGKIPPGTVPFVTLSLWCQIGTGQLLERLDFTEEENSEYIPIL